MEQRIIKLSVKNEYILGEGVVIGAAGSHDEVLLELDFRASPVWHGTTKKAVFYDALGTNPTTILLTTDKLVFGETEVYRISVPAEAKGQAGKCFLTIEGVVTNGETESVRVVTEAAQFDVLQSRRYEQTSDPKPVTPTQAEQLQAEIDAIKSDVVEAAESAAAAFKSEANAKVSESAAKSSEIEAKKSQQAAAKSETAAKASETAAAESAKDAAASKAAAAKSEANAKASETAAKSGETEAGKSAADAAASAGNALASANSAAGSATDAENAAQSAAQSAASAADSADAAAESEEKAATSEANAKASEEAAQTSAAAAAKIEETAKTAEMQRQNAETARQNAEIARNFWEDYDSTKSYATGNKVAYGGSSYLCIKPCTGIAPPNAEYWRLIASRGADGTGSMYFRGTTLVIKSGALPPSGDYETYSGDYSVKVPFGGDDAVLETGNKLMRDNLTVEAVSVSETTNPAGGKTMIIGE